MSDMNWFRRAWYDIVDSFHACWRLLAQLIPAPVRRGLDRLADTLAAPLRHQRNHEDLLLADRLDAAGMPHLAASLRAAVDDRRTR